MERMIAFNGAPAVYDAGFYNLGVRPTPEDLSLGDQIGGVPLAFTKLAELIAGGAVRRPRRMTGQDREAIAAELTRPAEQVADSHVADEPGAATVGHWRSPAGRPGGRRQRRTTTPTRNCVPNVIPGERLLRNGAFKAQGLRNVKFTGPYMHNGAKLNLRQVVEFYKTAGHFTNLNLNNLDAGLRIFDAGRRTRRALVEMMETGLTDWRVAHEEGKFDHPEICVPHGHFSDG